MNAAPHGYSVKKTIISALIICCLIGFLLSVLAKNVMHNGAAPIDESGRQLTGKASDNLRDDPGMNGTSSRKNFFLMNRLPGSGEVTDDPMKNLDRFHLAKESGENYRNEIMTSMVEDAAKLDDLPHYTWYPTRFGSVGEIDSHLADLKRLVVLGEAVKNNEASLIEKKELIAIKTKLVKAKLDDTNVKCAAIKKIPDSGSAEDENLRNEDMERCSAYIDLLEKKLEMYQNEIGDR